MKGKDYLDWFEFEERGRWLSNFQKQNLNSYGPYMEREFPNYFTFFYLSFNTDKSIEGMVYWNNIFHKYKKYDGLLVKPGFGPLYPLNAPKTFKK